MTPVTVDLLRHGDAAGGPRFRGSLDDPLTETGWAQMRAAVIGRQGWDALVTSPLLRCADFAAELASELQLPLHHDERLREIHFGAWEGRTYSELMGLDPLAVTRFFADPLGHPPPDAEPIEVFLERVVQILAELGQGLCGQRPLVITHGGVIRALLCHVRQWPLTRMAEVDVPHASLHRLVFDADEQCWQLRSWCWVPCRGPGAAPTSMP